jgi:Domain of unknown function (DUF6798)
VIRGIRPIWLAVGAIVFALAHTQAPLYWSNQNQYFLHGLAQAGLGQLDSDWLANTVDPTPVFSAGVAAIYRFAGPTGFYLVYTVILGVYFVSLMEIGAAVPGGPRTALGQLRLAAGLIAIHAALARWGSVQLLEADYPWFLQSGLAGQYVLGPGLQPSAFGVFLVAAIAAFVHRRLILTVLCMVFVCTVHATYLLPAALLTLGFMHVLWWDGRRRQCIAFGAGTFLGVLPVTIDGMRRFAPTTLEQFRQAQELLVEFRLPHHAVIYQWFDWIAALQIAWMALGVFLVRRSPLFPVMLIAGLGALVLSLVQMATDNNTLALLFPWRMSAVLVPISTTIILARVITAFHPRDAESQADPAPRARVVLIAIAVALAGSSFAFQLSGVAYRVPEEEKPLYELVRAQRQPGDTYILPITVPDLSRGPRGSPSTTFVPPREAAGENRIPIDLQRFRLATGVPIYVDFKSIPYKDVEVLEWHRRVLECQRWTGAIAPPKVSHIVTRADRELDAKQFERLYADANYKVYRVRRSN